MKTGAPVSAELLIPANEGAPVIPWSEARALLHLVDGRHADAAPPSRASDRQCQLAECHCHTPGDRLVDREFVVSAS
jgi:hypothetical protein